LAVLNLGKKKNKPMETTEANRIAHDNLWPAQEVVETNGILIVLKNTYGHSTYECAENFFERR
jgi:hypothetical protein